MAIGTKRITKQIISARPEKKKMENILSEFYQIFTSIPVFKVSKTNGFSELKSSLENINKQIENNKSVLEKIKSWV
jgi:selenocysteine-specific translation elongation factor